MLIVPIEDTQAVRDRAGVENFHEYRHGSIISPFWVIEAD